MSYSLSPTNDADYQWVYELNQASYHDVVVKQFGNWDEAFQQSLFSENWQSRKTMLIEVEGQRVGVLSTEMREDHLWLQELQVLPEHQNQGWGTRIVLDQLEKARAEKKPLRLQVLFKNQRACELYERIGFHHLKSLEHHYLMEIE